MSSNSSGLASTEEIFSTFANLEFCEGNLNPMYLDTNPIIYFFVEQLKVERAEIFGGACVGVFFLSLIVELVAFLKWYFASRKKITSNSL